jgi:hypothetical protein
MDLDFGEHRRVAHFDSRIAVGQLCKLLSVVVQEAEQDLIRL